MATHITDIAKNKVMTKGGYDQEYHNHTRHLEEEPQNINSNKTYDI